MKLTILGSGTAAPRLERSMSAYLIEADKKKLLFDSGAGTIRQLLKAKHDLLQIDHIFYTHLHNDHINDLPAILWSSNYGNKRKKTLYLYGPQGFGKFYALITKKLLKVKKFNFPIKITEMKKNTIIKINKIRITASRTKHTDSSIAYRIEHNKRYLVYTGDTDYSQNVISLAKDVNVLILECSFPKKVEGHLTPALCGKLAAEANAKKLVLTHFYPETDKVDVKKLCSKEFSGNITLAKDFMTLKI